ncbi:MAG: ABC transporter permease subunit [Anaerolineales bacterium]|jgi:ABC-type transport system involved in multi-copper enzyme maturation permease subunit
MSPIFILARMTFVQAIRRRIVLTGLLLGICFLVIFSIGFRMINTSTIGAVTPGGGEGIQHIIDTEKSSGLFLAGLYAVTFLGIAMAALLGADTLAGEINSGTIQVIVTKPIRRSDVVFGKWLGFAGLLGLYLLLLAGGTALSILVQSGYVAPHLVAGLALIYLESLLVMTVAMLFSSRFSALATGGVVFGLYGLAFIGGWIEQIGAVLNSQTAVQVGILTSLIIPSESLWRRAAYEMQSPLSGLLGISPFGATSVPSLLMVGYAVVYLLAVLALTVRVFQKRDL